MSGRSLPAARVAAAKFRRGEAAPVNLHVLARKWGLRIVVSDRAHPSAEATFVRKGSVPVVTVFPSREHLATDAPTPRDRFTLAHEFGHWAYDAVISSALNPLDQADARLPASTPGWDKAEERWCDYFAAQLLVSDGDIQDVTRKFGGEPSRLPAMTRVLANTCVVSPHVAAQRLVEYGGPALIGATIRGRDGLWEWRWATGLTRGVAQSVTRFLDRTAPAPVDLALELGAHVLVAQADGDEMLAAVWERRRPWGTGP